MKRRWRKDGPDYETGCQTYIFDVVHGGPGALVWWMHDDCWIVSAWTRDREWQSKVHYITVATAKRVAERWLDKYATVAGLSRE